MNNRVNTGFVTAKGCVPAAADNVCGAVFPATGANPVEEGGWERRRRGWGGRNWSLKGGEGITSVFTPPTTIFLVVVVAVVVGGGGGGQIKVAGIYNSPTNNVVWLILPITEYASPFLETLCRRGNWWVYFAGSRRRAGEGGVNRRTDKI